MIQMEPNPLHKANHHQSNVNGQVIPPVHYRLPTFYIHDKSAIQPRHHLLV